MAGFESGTELRIREQLTGSSTITFYSYVGNEGHENMQWGCLLHAWNLYLYCMTIPISEINLPCFLMSCFMLMCMCKFVSVIQIHQLKEHTHKSTKMINRFICPLK